MEEISQNQKKTQLSTGDEKENESLTLTAEFNKYYTQSESRVSIVAYAGPNVSLTLRWRKVGRLVIEGKIKNFNVETSKFFTLNFFRLV